MVGWIDRDKIGIRPFVRSSVPPSYLLFLLLSILSILSFAFYPSIPPSLSFAFYDKATATINGKRQRQRQRQRGGNDSILSILNFYSLTDRCNVSILLLFLPSILHFYPSILLLFSLLPILIHPSYHYPLLSNP